MESNIMEKRKWPAVKLAVLVVVLLAIIQLTDAQQKDEKSLLALMERNKEDTAVSTDEESGNDRYLGGPPLDLKGPARRHKRFIFPRIVCKRHCCKSWWWSRRRCSCCEWGFAPFVVESHPV
ncbi:uncharacterized protein [Branchiostoma lanceolatum]|uniref:uncharacterized protein n=1 Tax=Branchiostoma lanceolatum TaxID=7740 RepID=UPI003453119F